MVKFLVHIGSTIIADSELHVVCLVSALGLLVSAAMLPHSRAQLATRPLLYASACAAD